MPGKTHQHRQQCWLQVEKQTPFWIKHVHAVVAFYQIYRVGLISKEVWSWLLHLEIIGAVSNTQRMLELTPIPTNVWLLHFCKELEFASIRLSFHS